MIGDDIKTVRVGHKVIIMNGKDPLKYLDLTNDKVVKYKEPRTVTRFVKKILQNNK